MEQKIFNDEIDFLEKYLKCECTLRIPYYEKYDHLTEERFHKIILWLRDNYNFENGKHFPLIADFEKARESTIENKEYQSKTDDDLFRDPEAQKILSDIIRGLNEKSRKYVEEKKIADPVFLRKYEVKEQQRKRKELHDMGMVYSYIEGKYVSKNSMEAIGGMFKDTHTGQEFSFFKVETEPKF